MSDTIGCRTDLLRGLLTKRHPSRRTYLEIGVRSARNLISIGGKPGIGVDPSPPSATLLGMLRVRLRLLRSGCRLYRMRSDDFFAEHVHSVFPGGIDVVFIDGLHTYQQSLRDALNALKSLRPDGAMVLHDSNPQDEYAAAPQLPSGLEGTSWSGEVYKTVINLRVSRRDLDIRVLDCDHGLAVCRFGGSGSIDPHLPTVDEVDRMSFQAFNASRCSLLRLLPAKWSSLETGNSIASGMQ